VRSASSSQLTSNYTHVNLFAALSTLSSWDVVVGVPSGVQCASLPKSSADSCAASAGRSDMQVRQPQLPMRGCLQVRASQLRFSAEGSAARAAGGQEVSGPAVPIETLRLCIAPRTRFLPRCNFIYCTP
jgi:hypothetical protein